MIELTSENLLEALDRLGERHELAGMASEYLSDLLLKKHTYFFTFSKPGWTESQMVVDVLRELTWNG